MDTTMNDDHVSTLNGGDYMPDSQISHASSIAYWNTISPDVAGMLGGYPQVSRIDLQGSKNFLVKLRRMHSQASSTSDQQQEPSRSKLKLSVDCGAGIGRVTTGFLCQVSEQVDVVEPVEKFATTLRGSYSKSSSKTDSVLGEIFVQGLESWTPPANKKYDLIWNQWCLGHLTDSQLVDYLQRCIIALADGGWIVVKENLSTLKTSTLNGHGESRDMSPRRATGSEQAVSEDKLERTTKRPRLENTDNVVNANASARIDLQSSDTQSPQSAKNASTELRPEEGERETEDIYDNLDSSVTRSDDKFRLIFQKAGLVVVKTELQTGFPRGLGLYPVKMYALRPR